MSVCPEYSISVLCAPKQLMSLRMDPPTGGGMWQSPIFNRLKRLNEITPSQTPRDDKIQIVKLLQSLSLFIHIKSRCS